MRASVERSLRRLKTDYIDVLVWHGHSHPEEVSDTVIGFILALNRKLFFLHKTVIGGKWDRRLARPITRLKNQTLGLIGFGRIARAVAGKLKGGPVRFPCEVLVLFKSTTWL
jgi:phosphoglycerate dehydrogenase-like enzyme